MKSRMEKLDSVKLKMSVLRALMKVVRIKMRLSAVVLWGLPDEDSGGHNLAAA